jgi:hypothetical protein
MTVDASRFQVLIQTRYSDSYFSYNIIGLKWKLYAKQPILDKKNSDQTAKKLRKNPNFTRKMVRTEFQLHNCSLFDLTIDRTLGDEGAQLSHAHWR